MHTTKKCITNIWLDLDATLLSELHTQFTNTRLSVSSSQTSNKQYCCIKKTAHRGAAGGRNPTRGKKQLFFSFVNGPLAVLVFDAKTNFQKPQLLSSDHETHTECVSKEIQCHRLNVLFIHCAAWRFVAASVEFQRLLRRQQIRLLDKQNVG